MTIYYDAKDAIPNGDAFKPLMVDDPIGSRFHPDLMGNLAGRPTVVQMLPWNKFPPYDLRLAMSHQSFLVGCLIEPRGNTNVTHIYDPEYLKPLDLILTFDRELLNTPGLNTKLFPCAGAMVSPRNCETWNVPHISPKKEKTKLVSTLISDKTVFEGHKLRHELIPDLERLGVDIYGAAVGRPVDRKEEALDDYMFHVVIENSRADYYWSEKLVDAYLRGCMPIYWGCPSIAQFFLGRPMMAWHSKEGLFSLLEIISRSGESMYQESKFGIDETAKMLLRNNYDSYGPRILEAIVVEAGL